MASGAHIHHANADKGTFQGLTASKAVPAVTNPVVVAPFWFASTPKSAEDEAALQVLVAHVNSTNTDDDALVRYVRDRDPDLIVVLEVSSAWDDALKRRLPDYSHGAVVPRGDNFGIALLSRIPVETTETLQLIERAGPPSIAVSLDTAIGPVTVLATHPVPPIGASGANRRDAQLGAAATWAARQRDTHHTIVAGDLNATPWSYAFGLLLDAGLTDTRVGHGVHPSWPTSFSPLGVPIDHCLVSHGVVAVRHEVGADIGSDHRPIFVSLKRAP